MIRTLFLILFLFGCATTRIPVESKFSVIDRNDQQESKPKEKRSEIMGSSGAIDHSYPGKTYYLYGAEHLNLKNYYFDFPVVYNSSVKKWIEYFLSRGRKFFESYSQRAGRYAPILSSILEKHGLPKDLIFLAMAESGFQTTAKSYASAVGPWQFMAYTGKKFGLEINWFIDERRDPIKSTHAAAKYLKFLHEEFGEWELAAAAYNAGEGKIDRAIKRYNGDSFWDLTKGRYLKAETKNYIPKIMALAIIGKNLEAFGFGDIDFHEPLDFEEIEIPSKTDLVALSEKLNLEFEELKYLNPEILTWITPPDGRNYLLRVPVGYKRVFENCCDSQEYIASNFEYYTVAKHGQNLKHVAQKYRIRPEVLFDLNDLEAGRSLKEGTQICLPFRKGDDPKDKLYSSVYPSIPRRSVLRRTRHKERIMKALASGRKIINPTKYYTVKKGDTLWSVSRKTGTNLDTLIVSNINLVQGRQIKAGDRLAIQ